MNYSNYRIVQRGNKYLVQTDAMGAEHNHFSMFGQHTVWSTMKVCDTLEEARIIKQELKHELSPGDKFIE